MTNKILLWGISYFLTVTSLAQKKEDFQQMMQDNRINFYDVVKAAEKYYQNHDKDEEDSGYAKFMRWVYNNEYKYYPSGDRSKEDPLWRKHAWEQFLANTPQTRSVLTTANWEEIGPRTIDSITGHYSVGLGRVIDLLPVTADTLFLSSEAGGLWKSTDGGQTWNPKSDGLIAEGADALACSPFNHSKMYMDVQNPGNYYSYGIYRSDDGGETWYESNFNPANVGHGGLGDNFTIFTIKCHPTIADKIFIGTNQGLYISDDDLQTWTHVQQGVFDQHSYNDIRSIAFHPTDSNTMYVMDDYYWSDKSKIFITHDLGQTWTESNQIVDGNGDPNNKNAYLDTSSQCPDCVYFASKKGVWKSTNQGEDFTFLSEPDLDMVEGFAVNKDNPDNMIYGYLDVMKTTDGGTSWTQVTYWALGNSNGTGSTYGEKLATATNYVHADLHPVKYFDGSFYIGTDGFLCKSDDGGDNWEIISYGTGIRENYRLGVGQNDMDAVFVGSQDNGGSFYSEHGWVEITGGDGMEGIVFPLNEDMFIGSYQHGSRYRTFNEGVDKTSINPPGSVGGAWVAPFQVDPKDHYTIYDYKTGVWKSTDYGDSWTQLNSDLFGTDKTIKNAEIARNNTQIMLISYYQHLKKSTDGGNTFADINIPVDLNVMDIAFDPQNDDVFFTVYGDRIHPDDKVFMTNDGGSTWTNITYNLNNIPVHSIVVENTPEHRIYVGTELGVFYKDFDATTWQVLGNNLPKVKVAEIEIQEASNYLYATSWGRGLWRIKLPGRENYPEIAKVSITQPPTLTTPMAGGGQYVTADINYTGNLTAVEVYYSFNNWNLDQTMNMVLDNGKWVSQSPLPDGIPGDRVYFNIVAIGDNNDVTSTYKYMYELKPYSLCVSSGHTNYETGTTRVIFNAIDNATGKPAGYNDYTDMSTDVLPGNTYDLTVQVNTDGSNYTVKTKVWIDWNHDGDFEDAGEEYDLGTAQGVSDGPTSNSPLSIQIPDVPEGSVRMRVSTKYGSYPYACQTNFDGEVEDYSINIVRPDSPPVPDVSALPDIISSCAVDSLTAPTATDNEDGQIIGTTNTSFPITTTGTTVVTWSYTDSGGNTVTQQQNIIIQGIDTFAWTEDYESGSVTLNCWKSQQETGTADWIYASGAGAGSITSAHGGTDNAQFVSQNGTANPVTKLLSPLLDLSDLNYPVLSFWYGQEEDAGLNNYLYVYYSADNGNTWILLHKFEESANDWTYYELHLPEGSTTYQLAFEAINNGGYPNVIDDVKIEERCAGGTTVWTSSDTWDNGAPDDTKFVTLNNDYYTGISGAINACALKIVSGNTLNINEGGDVVLKYNLINEDEIYIDDKASLVQTAEYASVEGEAIYTLERKTGNLNQITDDVFWSTPLETNGYTLGDIVTNAWGYFSYDSNMQSWVNESASTVMQVGKGYAVSPESSFTGGVITVEFNHDFDKFNAGTIKVPVVINGTGAQDDDDWNFIGNPYPSAIDFEAFVADNPNIQGSFYLWTNCENSTTHTSSGFTVYNASGSTVACNGNGPTATRYIASAQSFAVEANNVGNIVFKNTQRVAGNNIFYSRPASSTDDKLWLDLLNNDGYFNQILIAFKPDATEDLDRLYDAHSINTGGEQDFYSLVNTDVRLSIQTLPAIEQGMDMVIPLGYEANAVRLQTIHLNNYMGDLQQRNIYLKDNLLGVLHDLKTSDYTFTGEIGVVNDRFELIITSSSMNEEEYLKAHISILQKDDNFILKTNNHMNISSVTVYDIQGRVLFDTNKIASSSFQFVLNVPQSMLLFNIGLENNQHKILKKLIKR